MSGLQYQGAAARLLWTVSPIVDIERDGWPEKLHGQAVAALQSWRDGDDEDSAERKARERDWCQAIAGACRSGELAHTVGNVRRKCHRDTDGVVWMVETSSNNFMSAAGVAAWMAKNGEAPGPLLQLWFEARGVTCAPAPASEANATPAPVAAPPFPVCKVPQKSQAPEWTGERLAQERVSLKAKGSRKPTQDLAVLSGLPGREITRREKAYRDEASQTGGREAGKAA